MSESQFAAKSQNEEHNRHLAHDINETAQQAALYAVEQLVAFAQNRGLISAQDVDYSRNLLLEQFGFSEPYSGGEAGGIPAPEVLQPVLNVLIDYGVATGLISENTDTYRDLLDSKIMGLLMARPSEVVRDFHQTEAEHGIGAATDAFYQLCIDSNYIRMDRVSNNVYWNQPTAYEDMEITINLSKPEKSPKEIAMAKLLPPPVYPKCQLCRENVGYAGRVNHPSRQNLRIIPLELNGEPWFFQYSPYAYYNEHCIVFHHDHVPMKLTKDTLRRLLAFTKAFPHYFIGSNADLPIVGGSILTHDHFQGGRHTFPIEKADVDGVFHNKAFPQVTAGIVNWPMSVIRFTSTDAEALLEAGNAAFEAWKSYNDPAVDILSHTEQEGETIPHNTVTPIVRRDSEGRFQMDLVLRNNRTSDEYPEGIFHPHREMHHIKKENIGLIEVMGLAILPGRLKEELDGIADILCGNDELAAAMQEEGHPLFKHADWIYQLNTRFGRLSDKETVVRTVQNEVGLKFSEILEHAGVYKRNPSGQQAFGRFMQQLGYTLGE